MISLRHPYLVAGSVLVGVATLALGAGALRLARGQLAPRPAEEVSWAEREVEASEDQLQRFAAAGVVHIGLEDGRVTLPFEEAADLLELFVGLDEAGEAALAHASPEIRVYAAYHAIHQKPARVRRLARLLADDAEVRIAAHPGDEPHPTTVSSAVLAMLCASAPEVRTARQLLGAVARDRRLLTVRAEARACAALPASFADRALDLLAPPVAWIARLAR